MRAGRSGMIGMAESILCGFANATAPIDGGWTDRAARRRDAGLEQHTSTSLEIAEELSEIFVQLAKPLGNVGSLLLSAFRLTLLEARRVLQLGEIVQDCA